VVARLVAPLRHCPRYDSVPFVGPILWVYGPKKSQIVNRRTPPSSPLRSHLVIASDAASVRPVRRGLAEIPASAFHAESIQNGQSFSEFRNLATVSRTFEGRQMFSELSPHCLLSGSRPVSGPALATAVKEVPGRDSRNILRSHGNLSLISVSPPGGSLEPTNDG
jgi:hypothetical protein